MNHSIGILKFEPILQYRIWGGENLRMELGKKTDFKKIGESWEISGVPDHLTLVAKGNYKGENLPDLIHRFGPQLVGDHCFQTHGDDFPILIKFIDANAPLSVQVHPNDHLAKKRHNSQGKNEMWYIMEAEEESNLSIGFSKELHKESYREHLKQGTLKAVLNTFKVNKGESYYLQAGRVHAIGKGILLAEIQQTSDVTYRIYDYDRVDARTGEKRKLHTEESIDAIDFSLVSEYQINYKKEENQSNAMIATPYFKTNYINAQQPVQRKYERNHSFKIFICISGEGIVQCASNRASLKKGETILLAANEEKLTILPKDKLELLEVFY
jgi:mannose-6-phosphate isomerase